MHQGGPVVQKRVRMISLRLMRPSCKILFAAKETAAILTHWGIVAYRYITIPPSRLCRATSLCTREALGLAET